MFARSRFLAGDCGRVLERTGTILSIPESTESRKAERDNGIASAGDGTGLSADEFLSAAKRLLDNGHHPIAIGKLDPERPDKPSGKAPWHTRVTGYRRRDPHPDRVKDWPADVAKRIREGERGILNLGAALPAGVIGLDVDQYDEKHGLDTIREREARLGALPPTYVVTARPYREGSGIRLFQVPESWRGKTALKNDAGEDGHVELIQWWHRLVTVPPSWHHTGARYWLYHQSTGQEVPDIPPRAELPKLPDAWLADLKTDPTKAVVGEATDEQVEAFAAEYTRSEQPWHLTKYIVPRVRNANGSTRNAAFDALHEAARDARVGWCSWADAVAEIETAARDSYAARGGQLDEKDFARSVKHAVSEANAENMSDLEARYAKRLANERCAKVAVDDWAPKLIDAEDDVSGGDDAGFDREVQRRRRALRVARAAERAEAADGWTLPPISDEIVAELEKGVPAITYVVEGLAPKGSNVLLVAERKVGKTTLVMNLVVAAVRGEKFLDRYAISLPEGSSVTYLNFELDREQANRWLEEMGAGQREDSNLPLYVENWKGYRIPLPAEHVEDALVDLLLVRRSSMLVIDPYGAMISHEENSNTDVREWTNAIDRIARRAGLQLVVIAAHSGSSSIGAEDVRVRGAYRLEDWMSVKWSYTHAGEVNEQDPLDTSRYLAAWGRDVSVPGFELAYDPVRRKVVAAAGGRSKIEAVIDKHALRAYDAMAAHTCVEQQKGTEEPIELNAGDLSRKAKVAPTSKHAELFAAGRDSAVENGWLNERKQGGAKMYSLGECPPQRERIRLNINPVEEADDQ